MKKGKVIKITLVVILVAIVLALNISNTFAAINEEYYYDIKESLGVNNAHVDRAVESSPLLDAIAILVYAVGVLLEKILGSIFEFMSGDNVFPWADAILFNAIPMLDINIFNPSKASIIYTLKSIMENLYWTIFTLALSFFGIAVMITAIKLAISTIASDKALYKQAITKWVMGFVMLWGIHFFMSFAIYLNEQLTMEAAKIATTATKDVVIDIGRLTNDDERLEITKEFVDAMTANNFSWSTFVAVTVGIIFVGLKIAATVFSGGTLLLADVIIIAGATLTGAVAGGVAIDTNHKIAFTELHAAIDRTLIDNADSNVDNAVNTLYAYPSVTAELLNNSGYVDSLEHRLGYKLRNSEDTKQWLEQDGVSSKGALSLVALDVAAIVSNHDSNMKATSQVELGDNGEKIDYLNFLVNYKYLVDNSDDTELIKREYITLKQYKIIYYSDATTLSYCLDGENAGQAACSTNEYMYALTFASEGTAYGNPAKRVNYDVAYYLHAQIVTDYAKNYNPETNGISDASSGNNLVLALANAFKKMALTRDGAWLPNRVSIEGALLYSILVAQSLIFFISYTKRLFYIVILIIMAPVVVVFDFFNKFST